MGSGSAGSGQRSEEAQWERLRSGGSGGGVAGRRRQRKAA